VGRALLRERRILARLILLALASRISDTRFMKTPTTKQLALPGLYILPNATAFTRYRLWPVNACAGDASFANQAFPGRVVE
jgi:hypothetical protein